MTTRHAGYVVTLRDDIREDDAEAILTALRMVSGVLSVKPIEADHSTVIATERVRAEARQRVADLLQEWR